MTKIDSTLLDRVLAALPRAYAGPGGAVALLHEGEVLVRHAWGYANAERRIAFTPRTLFRMCSITKQFTCAVALDSFPHLAELDGAVRARLPALEGPAPSAAHLCHNQSGLRDYWAVAMLHGSPAEAPFGDTEAARLISATRTLQFSPGTRFSYVNQNFRLLSDILQDRLDMSFSDLLRGRIFDRIGMETAFLAADTRAMPDGSEGYEGAQAAGFRAAENRIVWTGDAGLGASLDDMIAWERHVDATRDDPAALYSRLAGPVTFADGAPATYGFGLGRSKAFGRAATGHGGALRGWRSHRLYLPAERLSVVVMFNHFANAGGAALDVVAAALGEAPPVGSTITAPSAWTGAYIEPETGLAVRIASPKAGSLELRFGHSAEAIEVRADNTAGSLGSTRLHEDEGMLVMERPSENLVSRLAPMPGETGEPEAVIGRYLCAELGAELTITGSSRALYGAFSGFLGQGRMELLDPIAGDVWALPCPRALDHTPPGDWTLAFRRDERGVVTGAMVGCWLARGLWYARAD
jgi:D-aminopeptidase